MKRLVLVILMVISIGCIASALDNEAIRTDFSIGAYYVADIDLPLNAYFEYRTGYFAVKDHTGGMFLALVGNELTLEAGIDLGARLSFMGFYIEGGYVFTPSLLIGEIVYSHNQYPRFGLGFTMEI